MIDHFEIKVKDLQISEGFYRSFLAPLGYKLAFKTSSLISFLAPIALILVVIFGWLRGHKILFTLLS